MHAMPASIWDGDKAPGSMFEFVRHKSGLARRLPLFEFSAAEICGGPAGCGYGVRLVVKEMASRVSERFVNAGCVLTTDLLQFGFVTFVVFWLWGLAPSAECGDGLCDIKPGSYYQPTVVQYQADNPGPHRVSGSAQRNPLIQT
ncbi:MAG: hypothetical protein ACP5MD_16785 [Verrucomicrobiia bacterium]